MSPFVLGSRVGWMLMLVCRTTGGRRAAKNQRRLGFSIHRELEAALGQSQ